MEEVAERWKEISVKRFKLVNLSGTVNEKKRGLAFPIMSACKVNITHSR